LAPGRVRPVGEDAARAAPAEGGGAVRPAAETDLDEVVEVIWEVAAEGRWLGAEVPFDREERRFRLAEHLGSPRSLLLVAPAGAGRPRAGGHRTPEALAGELHLEIKPYGVADFGMAVRRDWRGRGLGRALLTEAIDWARAAGAHKVALEVWPDNAPAVALYRGAGFHEEGLKRRHYRRADGQLWSSLLMGLPLGGSPWPLRPAVDADGWDLVGLVAACWSEYPGCVMDPHGEEPDLLAPATAWAARGGRMWVVEGPVGGVEASMALVCRGQTAEIQKVYVARRRRRRGLASYLVAHAEAHARRAGATMIEAWSDTRFTDAHLLYRACGYRRMPDTRSFADLSSTVEAHFVKQLAGPGESGTGDPGNRLP
jgi:ribosomal protein S18 acetylase RimI-like enzyme